MAISLLSRPRTDASPAAPPASPAANRPRRAWWRDPRVIGGIGIVVACTFIGARLLSGGGDTVAVWQVNRDIAAGAVVSADDVTAVQVERAAATTYAVADGLPTAPLTRDLLAGELMPAPTEVPPADVRWVTVPVEPLHAPVDLAPGERVDVYATQGADLGEPTRPELVLPAALVSSVSADAVGFGGEYGVVLEVAPASAADVLAAVRTGAVDLVRVPVGEVAP